MRLLGPFSQLLTMDGLPARGALKDEQLSPLPNAGLLTAQGQILALGNYQDLKKAYPEAIECDKGRGGVLLPAFVDSHTHICFAGSRAMDYARRNAGLSYQEIARQGGGIWNTVQATREASVDKLASLSAKRAARMSRRGCATIEVKSGYGLSLEHELQLLEAIAQAQRQVRADLIPTCLAAHICPRDFEGGPEDYLEYIAQELLPQVKKRELAKRVDIFIEDGAFAPSLARNYLNQARALGFDITVHADQFSTGGSAVAIECGALSADHLEASTREELHALAQSSVVATALPGASLGLGCAYTPGRELLDAGACLAIASDFNPGSAPMGDLLTQAAIYAAAVKLCNAEVFSAITHRAALALGLQDRGVLRAGLRADLVVFPTEDYREILYHQGQMGPSQVWIEGQDIHMHEELI